MCACWPVFVCGSPAAPKRHRLRVVSPCCGYRGAVCLGPCRWRDSRGTVRATHWQGGGGRLGARELAGRQALLPSQGRRGLLLPRGSDGCFESLPVASCHVRLRLCTRRDCLKAGVSTLECHGGPSKEMQSGVQMPLQMSGISGRWPDVGVTQSSSLTATG